MFVYPNYDTEKAGFRGQRRNMLLVPPRALPVTGYQIMLLQSPPRPRRGHSLGVVKASEVPRHWGKNTE